jgi:hypothetical protein
MCAPERPIPHSVAPSCTHIVGSGTSFPTGHLLPEAPSQRSWSWRHSLRKRLSSRALSVRCCRLALAHPAQGIERDPTGRDPRSRVVILRFSTCRKGLSVRQRALRSPTDECRSSTFGHSHNRLRIDVFGSEISVTNVMAMRQGPHCGGAGGWSAPSSINQRSVPGSVRVVAASQLWSPIHRKPASKIRAASSHCRRNMPWPQTEVGCGRSSFDISPSRIARDRLNACRSLHSFAGGLVSPARPLRA